MRPDTTLRPLLCAALALGLLSPPLLRAQTDVDRTTPASAQAAIEIENSQGSVRVLGWDREEVHVTGSLGEDVSELAIKGGPDRILIEVETPDRRGWGRRDLEADLEVKVPRAARLEIETLSASVEVGDLTGRLEIETVSGSITVTGAPSLADLESVSGSIRLEGRGTPVVAESVSGSLRLRGVAGRAEASTVSGSIDLEAGELERGDLESVSGSIDIECTLGRGARLDAATHSGNLTVALPADVSAVFEASTFSGRIVNELGPEAERDSKWVPSRSLEFTTGDGAAEVTLETFSGNLRISRR